MNYSVVGNSGKIYGPFSEKTIRGFIAAGKIKSSVLLVTESGDQVMAKDIFSDCFLSENTIDLTYLSEKNDINITRQEDRETFQNNSVNIELSDINAPLQNNDVDIDLSDTPEPLQNNAENSRYNDSDTAISQMWTLIANDGLSYGPYTMEVIESFVSQRRVDPYNILVDENGRRCRAKDLIDFSLYNRNDCISDEIKGLNWGAFLLPFFWGLAHKTYISLICIFPSFTPIIALILLFKGNEWGWKNRHFSSVEEFRRVQKIWMYYGFFIVGFYVLISFVIVMSVCF